MELDLKAIREKRTNLNAQEIGDDAERAQELEAVRAQPGLRRSRSSTQMVKAGVKRLTEMQLCRRRLGLVLRLGRTSTAAHTAAVVHGLQIAKQNDVALVPGVLERGVAWLKRYQAEQVDALDEHRRRWQRIDKHKPGKRHTPTTSTRSSTWCWSTPA